MLRARFSDRLVAVPTVDRGATYQGIVLGPTAGSRDHHLVKRVVIEQQWAYGTTFDEYLTDIRHFLRERSVKVAVYERRGRNVAALVGRTDVPPERSGPNRESMCLVVYDADNGTIVTGYQVSSLDTVAIPENAIWLP